MKLRYETGLMNNNCWINKKPILDGGGDLGNNGPPHLHNNNAGNGVMQTGRKFYFGVFITKYSLD